MAVTHQEVQITWPTAANSLAITTGAGNGTSEVVTINTAAIDCSVSLKANNDGTAGAGDTVDFFILYTSGDPDGTGSDEYDTVNHADFLCQIDTNAENPGIQTVRINPAVKSFKIYAVNNANDTVTVSATMTEVRG